jgi:GT2 family glycosyltransferase
MTRPVSVVIPSLEQVDLLERALPHLFEEFARRGYGDEVVVVDDTGDGVLAEPLAARFPDARVVARSENGGFGAALLSGVEAAAHELVFSMNPDVIVRPGFLDPLVASLSDDDVFAAAPRVLLNGDPERVESWTGLVLRGGEVHIEQPALAGAATTPAQPARVAFAVGGTCLFRKAEFVDAGGFDALFEPFYWEDIDLCWTAQRRGKRVVYEPGATVEHHHRGTIGQVVDPVVVRAAIEKNRLLFAWKHLGAGAELDEHVAALLRTAVDAYLAEDRERLLWLLLALEQADDALRGRAEVGRDGLQGFEALRATLDDA